MTDNISRTRLQVMWNRLLALVEEQGQVLTRAAFSPIVRECGDISAGLFDADGPVSYTHLTLPTIYSV